MKTHQGMHVSIQSPDSLFDDQADAWDRLSGGVPFRKTLWLKPLWRQFGDVSRSCFLTVMDEDEQLRGLLPLERCGSRGWRSIGESQCTDYVSMLCEECDRPIVAELFAKFLLDHVNDKAIGWDYLQFAGVIAGDPGMACLIEELEARQLSPRIESRMSLWYRACDQTWEEFLQSHSRKHRHRIRSLVRQFDNVDDPIRVVFPTDQEEIEAYLQELIRLHQKHWQSLGERGTYATEEMVTFIHETALAAFSEDRLFFPVMTRTHPATGEETIVAAQLHFLGDDGRLYCYSVGVNYEHGELTPGKLLNAYLLHHAHHHRYSGIDFMRGDEEFKQRLHAKSASVLKISMFAPTALGKLAMSRHDWAMAMKQIYRKLRNRPRCKVLSVAEAFDSQKQSVLPAHVASSNTVPTLLGIPRFSVDDDIGTIDANAVQDLLVSMSNRDDHVKGDLIRSENESRHQFNNLAELQYLLQNDREPETDDSDEFSDEGPVILPFHPIVFDNVNGPVDA